MPRAEIPQNDKLGFVNHRTRELNALNGLKVSYLWDEVINAREVSLKRRFIKDDYVRGRLIERGTSLIVEGGMISGGTNGDIKQSDFSANFLNQVFMDFDQENAQIIVAQPNWGVETMTPAVRWIIQKDTTIYPVLGFFEMGVGNFYSGFGPETLMEYERLGLEFRGTGSGYQIEDRGRRYQMVVEVGDDGLKVEGDLFQPGEFTISLEMVGDVFRKGAKIAKKLREEGYGPIDIQKLGGYEEDLTLLGKLVFSEIEINLRS